MSAKEKFVISGTAYWAHIHEVNKLSDKFQMDLSIDEKTKAKLKKMGIDIKTKETEDGENDERGEFVTLKSSYPPKVVDAKKKEVGKKTLIGNGSKVNVLTHVYEWKFNKKSGNALGLDAIQVVELVEFRDTTTDLFEEEAGFEMGESKGDDDFEEVKDDNEDVF